eukprot:6547120-Pyramimonas_sp.AAC.1
MSLGLGMIPQRTSKWARAFFPEPKRNSFPSCVQSWRPGGIPISKKLGYSGSRVEVQIST